MNATRLAEKATLFLEECLRCSRCKSKFRLDQLLYCPSCKHALEYAPIGVRKSAELRACLLDKRRTSSRYGHFRFIEFLPVPPLDAVTSLGEGNTPLLHCEGMRQRHSFNRLYLKDEGRNPTGSWKDRAISLVVNCAKGFGYQTVSVYSCGNAGVSTAAYGAKAGMKSVVFVLPTIDQGMHQRMTSYGGRVVPIEISRRDLWTTSKLGELLEEAQRQTGWFPVTSVRNPYAGSPFYTEGFKTIAFEIFQDLGEVVPDWVFAPAGTGEGLSGVWKGFKDIESVGCSNKLPRMVGVQSQEAAPLVHAFQGHGTEFSCEADHHTIASGLEVMISSRQALAAIHESHGHAESVTDLAIRQAMVELRQSEGVSTSPEGAVTLAAAQKMRLDGRLKEDDLVVCISSAAGSKCSEPSEKNPLPAGLPLDLQEVSDYVDHLSEPMHHDPYDCHH
jgi:threonine synthase